MGSVRAHLKEKEGIEFLVTPSDKEIEDKLTLKSTERKDTTESKDINGYADFVKRLSEKEQPLTIAGTEVKFGVMQVTNIAQSQEGIMANSAVSQVSIFYNGDITVGRGETQSYFQSAIASHEYYNLTGNYPTAAAQEIETIQRISKFELIVVLDPSSKSKTPKVPLEQDFYLKKDIRS
ncbi:MAG: hypothetical protein ACREBF_04660 [Candidatus Micrarchaeales archaeon]